MKSSFARDPAEFLMGSQRNEAVESIRQYFAGYTGSKFEQLADGDPNEITANDIVAVTTLGVSVPASTAIWLLDEGRATVRGLLQEIPQDQHIWDDEADLADGGPAWKLWNAIIGAGWKMHHGGMARTKTSKLLAAKRPHLVPIYDRLVAAALFHGRPDNYWAPWLARLRGSDGETLRQQAADVLAESATGARLSVLRTLDVVIWMWAKNHLHELAPKSLMPAAEEPAQAR